MAKEQIYIVVSHKNSLKSGSRTEWEVTEKVEFINQLKKRHINQSSVIANYLEKKMISGKRFGLEDYDKFENYIRTKYPAQLKELDNHYRPEDLSLSEETSPALEVDKEGVITVSE